MKAKLIEQELLEASNGKGSKMLSPLNARRLIVAGEAKDLFLVSIEVYELRGELEIPLLDLSLYNVCNEEPIFSLPIADKKRACRLAFDNLLEIIENDKRSFGFRVWLED